MIDYSAYASVVGDSLVLVKTAGSPLATSTIERAYRVTWKLKLKSDSANVIGEVDFLVEVSPSALRYNLQNCDDSTHGKYLVKTNQLATNFTNEVHIDASNVGKLYISQPIHQYPVSCRIKTWEYETYLPLTNSYLAVASMESL